MLIHAKLPPGVNYPQLNQFPENYDDFLAAFRDGQTVDRNNFGLFPNDLMQLIALNKEWSDSRRSPADSSIVRLSELLNRIESCKQRYWDISKDQRIEWGLRPDPPAGGYSGDLVIGLVEQLLLQALRGSYPFNTDDFSSIAWAQAQSMFGGPRQFTSASEVVSAVEPMIAELEGKLSACEADQR